MDYKPTISELIISHLLSARSTYRQKKVLWELVQKKVSSKQGYNLGIHRLLKRGFIEKDKEGYILTEKGKIDHEKADRLIRGKIRAEKKIIVIFDIPEPKKKIREWLRGQLKWWDFKMIQKSAWVGNGPLPAEFKQRLKDLKIEKSVLMFTLKTLK